MSDEKNPASEESPETHPEVTGEVTATDEPTPEPPSGAEVRPEASGEVTMEASPVAPEAAQDPEEPASTGNVEAPQADLADAISPDSDGSEAEAEPEVAAATEAAASAAETAPGDAAAGAAMPVETTEETGEEGPGEGAAKAAEGSGEKAVAEKPKKKRKRKRKKAKKRDDDEDASPAEDPPEIAVLRAAKDAGEPVEGRVFGWNNGGFHVVVGAVPAFCPRSEMEADGRVSEPESYMDKTLQFLVLRIQGKARRIVLSRAALERREQHRQREETLQEIAVGAVTKGTVTSVVDFGAFVDLGGVEGLVHRSELTRRRYETLGDVVAVGDEVEVKVLKVEKGGRRISLSMKALEPDPWKGVGERFAEGTVVTGKVEHTAPPGAFIELEPGLTGLLPTSEMNIPREAIPARIFPPGKEVKVVVMSLDPRRRRISLALEGSKPGASHKDLAEFQKSQKTQETGFGALAAAFAKLSDDGD